MLIVLVVKVVLLVVVIVIIVVIYKSGNSTVKTITTNVDGMKITEVFVRSKISKHSLSNSVSGSSNISNK